MTMTLILNPWILHRGIISTTLLFTLLLHVGHIRAQSPGSPPEPYGQSFNPSMGVVIIVLIAALFFMGFFSIYIRHCADDSSTGGATRRALAGSIARSRRAQRGLDPVVIGSFPTFNYSAVKELKIGKGALECAVCLNEFEDDDTLRLIPKCDHVFHPDCIDAWLVVQTTCPVCRTDLKPDEESGASTYAPPETRQDDSLGEVEEGGQHRIEEEERDSMEQPLQGVERAMSGNSTMRRNISLGRARWFGRMKFARSFSTGHMAVKQWENMDRFTLRLPEEVRKQLVSGKLERTTSLVVLPRETSSRRGYRTGFGEGSSRGNRFGSLRSDRPGRSDRWVFSLVPPFFSRAPSLKSPKVAAPAPLPSRDGSSRGSVRVESSRLPV